MDTHSPLSFFIFFPQYSDIHMHTHSMLDWQAWPHAALWHSQCVSMKTEKMRGFSWRIELLLPLTHSHKHTHTHTQLSNLLMIPHRSDLHFSEQHHFTFEEARPRSEASAAKLDKQMLATKCESLLKWFAGNSAWCTSLRLPGEGQRQSLHQFLCRS